MKAQTRKLSRSAEIVRFINQEFLKRKSNDPRFSLRKFAAGLGMEAATLSHILRGKRRLTFDAAQDLLSKLDLPLETRSALLLTLDDVGQLDSATLPNRVLTEEEMTLLAGWEAYAGLSALEISKVPPTPGHVAAFIGADPERIANLFEIMTKFGILKKSGAGYSLTGLALTTQNDSRSTALKVAHREWIEKALENLDQENRLRDFSGITMAIPREKFPEARRRILEFRRSLSTFLNEGNCDSVVRLNIQLFCLSKDPP